MTTETSLYEYAKNGLSFGAARTAIWFYGRSLSYGELFGKIDNVADHLYSLGVREGTVVTIHLPNCPQAVMAIYAVAKLGGVCNMVHAQTPADALRENLAFTESDILITYLPQCTALAEQSFFVDLSHYMGFLIQTGFRLKNKDRRPANVPAFEALERSCPQKAVVPDQAALAEKCAVYFHSSGTTGTPKTVMHCHRAINNWVANAMDYFRQESMVGDRRLAVLPIFHGSGVALDMQLMISGGGTLVPMPVWNVKQAVRWIERLKITSLSGVPKMYQGLLTDLRFTGESLLYSFVSGDSVGEKLKKEFRQRVKRECLYEGYGMTETVTAVFSCGKYHNNESASGYPLIGCEIRVLNESGEAQAVGEGEFIVSTNTMMMGYFKDETATKATFLSVDGKQWLRTGDYGRIDEEGYLYFVGRIKNTIIHNGYNVFPSELEAITQSLSEVKDVCVVGVTDLDSGTQIVRACLVLADGVDPAAAKEKLKELWAKKLPRYAIPRQIRLLKELPRNRMAKVDRRALEKME